MKLLCKLGIHRPLRQHAYYFKDIVSRKQIYTATCSCNKKWMVDSKSPWFGFKTLKHKEE